MGFLLPRGVVLLASLGRVGWTLAGDRAQDGAVGLLGGREFGVMVARVVRVHRVLDQVIGARAGATVSASWHPWPCRPWPVAAWLVLPSLCRSGSSWLVGATGRCL